eukprot:CAMPEP_0197021058 /NCGR_PEP_ID=MMETSP1384-20130603/1945_1 /TAXON_ID=29189 /ORGANISM="Ammonia sp." /LENGTH=250 /DNA_ID=CAMNT_0042448807 /DNA_START=34 /DNA_END=786 /DNA_ORIENTATION=+
MAACSSQLTKSNITLRGSTAIVCEFFGYAINSILYQRAIYPENTFEAKKQYNLQVMVTKDKELQSYLNSMLQQIQQWLLQGDIQKLVLVIASIDDGTPLERWCFDIETDKSFVSNDNEPAPKKSKKQSNKSLQEIQNEIRGIIRQITSSVTFLPLLEVPCSFDVLVYTDKECKVPKSWQESQPKYIANSETVRLRSFNTKIHKVDAMVSYKVNDDDEEEEEEEDEQQGFHFDENSNFQNLVYKGFGTTNQ